MAVLLLLTFDVEDVSLPDPFFFSALGFVVTVPVSDGYFFTLLNLMGVYCISEYIQVVLFKNKSCF